jgi:hypothetical protein
MIWRIWLGCLVVGVVVCVAVPALAEVLQNWKCGMPIGCTGQYNCCGWDGYPCTTPGVSHSKKGITLPLTVCMPEAGQTCEQWPQICQVDIYYKDNNCGNDYCNNCPRLINACIPQGE